VEGLGCSARYIPAWRRRREESKATNPTDEEIMNSAGRFHCSGFRLAYHKVFKISRFQDFKISRFQESKFEWGARVSL